MPSWCTSFTATVNGKLFKGDGLQTVVIDRSWKTGDKIHVSFLIPFQVVKAGKSYPGQSAFQHGPQVLALDSLLNVDLLRAYSLSAGQKVLVEKPAGENQKELLPPNWIGQQAYSMSITTKSNNANRQQLVLVPFADASQNGGAMKVWLPIEIPKPDEKK